MTAKGETVIVKIIFLLIIFTLISGCKIYTIPAGSMEPTIKMGDQILTINFNAESVERGDVIVFSPPAGETEKEYIKRCIAVGGDTFDIKKGSVFLNGKKLDEPYIQGKTIPGSIQLKGIVPQEMIVVLGDNREHSFDSRYFGYVPISRISRKAIYVYGNKKDSSRGGEIK